jgi:hypothetical protein
MTYLDDTPLLFSFYIQRYQQLEGGLTASSSTSPEKTLDHHFCTHHPHDRSDTADTNSVILHYLPPNGSVSA